MANDQNPPGDLTGNVGDSLKKQFEDKINPQKMFSEQNLAKKRSAFWTCLIAAFLLVVLALGAALYYNANKVDTFENALIQNVDPSLGLDELSLQSFARETIFYLNDAQDTWNPQIVVGGFAASQLIPQSFRDHMATVKGWFSSATAVLLAGAGIALVLLGRALIGRKGSKKSSFSLGGYYLGALIPLAIIGGIGLWGVLSFDNLWTILHRALIPDGIFDVLVPVMGLFPVGLFAAYLRPIAVTFGLLAVAVLVLPLILAPLSKPLTNLLGKSSGPASSTRGRAAGRTPSKQSATRQGSAVAVRRASGTSTAKKPAAKKPAAKKSATDRSSNR